MLSSNKFFETCVKARLIFGDGSCEIKLWKLCQSLVDELQGGFLDHELMSTLGLIYLNF
jgi:hypothetical protein